MEQPLYVADPFVLAGPEGRYYLYGSSREAGQFRAYSSRDLCLWRDEGVVYRAGTSGWDEDCHWAPECHALDGSYALFFSANQRGKRREGQETFRIGVALAKHPLGPFEKPLDRPIFDPGYPIIDANVFMHRGQKYLYYSRCCYEHRVGDLEESWVYGAPLKDDLSGVAGEPALLLRPQQPWEGRSAAATGRRWNEGSFLYPVGNKFGMTFSANYFAQTEYAVGYALGESPLGPFEKSPGNPLLESRGEVVGPGHSCFVTGPEGRTYMVYHAYTAATGSRRVAFFSPVEFDAQGRCRVGQEARMMKLIS